MSERDHPSAGNRSDPSGEYVNDVQYQPPRLSPEEIERLKDYEELEDFIEERPEGDLSIISDEDVPGAPG